MSDTPGNLVIEPLRAIRSDIGQLRESVADHGLRLSQLELGLAGMRRDMALHSEAVALLGVRMDRIETRLDRIDRRLGLIEV